MSRTFNDSLKRGTRQFESFIAPLQSRGTRFALKKLGNREDAEDAVSEAMRDFAIALRGDHLAPDETEQLFWTILRRRISDQFRRRPKYAIQPDSQEMIDGATIRDKNARTASQIYQEREALHQREVMINSLAHDEQRKVAYLHEIVGLTISEIAAQLGCTRGSAASHWFRALEILEARFPAFIQGKPRRADADCEA
jgi:RNA polymerase sigma factor (sigma-70 family)